MKTNQQLRRQRWARTLLSLAGLTTIPACTSVPGLHREPDHVFAMPGAHEAVSQEATVPSTPAVQAVYPSENPRYGLHQQEAHDNGFARVAGLSRSETSPALDQSAAPAPGIARISTASAVDDALANESEASRSATNAVYTQYPDEPQQSPIRLLSGYTPTNAESPVHVAAMPVTFTPATPRVALSGQPSGTLDTVAASPLADMYPDEYVFDGGDSGLPVHRYQGDRAGLEPEDTVAEFRDHTGASRVSASNRVAVYAPRFGSVRTVDGIETDVRIDKASQAKDFLATQGVHNQYQSGGVISDTEIVGMEARRGADGMQADLPPLDASGTSRPNQNLRVEKGTQGTAVTGTIANNQRTAIDLESQIQNAIYWSHGRRPFATSSTVQAADLIATNRVQQTIGVEDERKTTGQIRIVKLADRGTAQSGDIVTFTLQFNNPGDFDVYDVVIVDNLTPRLQYVPDSGTIDGATPGAIDISPNREGTSVLTFTLDGP
ncbi:MAG: DUF11 domain-containing protein, partial [Planctomycetaceae bacterium]|nr:DUF11 domain-containing protein [Planctomycetaceae bacterium]